MKNNEEKVHVRAYVKDDGTHVKEHYRGLPDGMSNTNSNLEPDATLLKGSIEKNIYLGRNDLKSDEVYIHEMEILQEIRKKVKNTAYKSEKNSAKLLNTLQQVKFNGNWYKVNADLEDLKNVHEAQHAQQKDILMRMGNTKSQREYSKLYDIYVEQHARLIEQDRNIRLIEYGLENQNIEMIKEAAEDYNSTYNKVHTKYDNLTKLRRKIPHSHPIVEEMIITDIMFILSIFHRNKDAHELWQTAISNNFNPNSKYMNQNANTVHSISDLPQSMQETVKKKVKKQFNKEDALGIIFHKNSSLANSIEQHEKFKKCINDNLPRLLKKEKINTSINFLDGLNNVGLSLGKADILEMHIDYNGYLNAKILDTYDFNEDDPDWKVDWAYNLQDRHKLRSFYTITEISIPVSRWINYVNISNFEYK